MGTPDPRQTHPPLGQKLILDWSLPQEVLDEQPKIVLHLLFWDHTQKQITYPVTYRTGYEVYSLLNEEYEKNHGLLTYRAEIIIQEGKVYRDWKHQLWV